MREELMEEFYREVHDQDRHSIDFRKLRATDIRSNKRVHIPRPVGDTTEGELMTRGTLIKHRVKKFKTDNKTDTNLTQSEKRGIDKLEKRVKAGKVVIFETDKSGKLAIATLDTYKKMGNPHTVNDVEVTW